MVYFLCKIPVYHSIEATQAFHYNKSSFLMSIYFCIYPFWKPPGQPAVRLYRFVLVCFASQVFGGYFALLCVDAVQPVIKHCHVGCWAAAAPLWTYLPSLFYISLHSDYFLSPPSTTTTAAATRHSSTLVTIKCDQINAKSTSWP